MSHRIGVVGLSHLRSAARYGWLRGALDRHLPARPGGLRLALWGLAYKKNTRSTKNSAALRLIAALSDRGTLVVYDPEATLPAPPAHVEIAPTAEAAVGGADGLVILTDWDEFAACDPAAVRALLRAPVVVDAVDVLDPDRARAAGLTYVAMGEAA